MKSKYTKKEIKEFLRESNHIEREYSEQAFKDALLAWEYLKDKPFLSPEIVLETHRILMHNIYPQIAGQWRDADVWIGGKRKNFISIYLIKSDVSDVLNAIAVSATEEDTKNCHVMFEFVHPFLDGNGRTGRLLYLWNRMQLGLPIHIIHADWDTGGDEQRLYYQWFK